MKFEFLKSFFPSRLYLGVDIGTASIKIAEIGEKDDQPFLKNYGILESYGHLSRLNSAIQTSSLKITEKETAELLRALLGQMKVKTTDAAASLPSFSAFTSLLEIPAMSPAELSQAIKYQARLLVPLPITEVAIDWIPVGEFEDEKGVKKQQILLISVPNEQIKQYQTIFRMAGLNLRILEIEGLSLARVLTLGDPSLSLIIDIGARSTAIAVAENGFLKYSGQTDFSGNSLTQAVGTGLGINIRRAETLKRQKGLTATGGEYGLSTLMFPYLDVILSEAKRVKDIYEKNYRGKIEKVILSGGGANLLGLEKYASDWFGLPTKKAEPFRRVVFPPALSPLAGEIGAPMAVALGLGVKQFI